MSDPDHSDGRMVGANGGGGDRTRRPALSPIHLLINTEHTISSCLSPGCSKGTKSVSSLFPDPRTGQRHLHSGPS